MTLRRTLLLLVGLAVFVQWASWREARHEALQREPVTPLQRNESGPLPASRASVVQGSVTTEAQKFSAAERAAVRALLVATYRRELLGRELTMEQARYGATYWAPGADGATLGRLAREKEAILRELNAEANAMWRENAGADASAEPIVLAAFFDDDHPGPNVAFLSMDARDRFERAAMEADDTRPDWTAIAERVLVPSDAEHYRRWNAPAAIEWRERLAGFGANETEFLAIVRAAGGETATTHTPGAALIEAMGAERFEQLQRWLEPAAIVARSDLRRTGLPVEHAAWLASTRSEAIARIQSVWQDPLLSDGVKRDQVGLIEQGYARMIATRLQRPQASLDGLEPSP